MSKVFCRNSPFSGEYQHMHLEQRGCIHLLFLYFWLSLFLSVSDRRVEFGGCEADRGCGGEDLFSSEDSQ